MKLIKMLSLAMAAAAIVMAFVGATSAMAAEEHELIGLCLKAELLLCEKASRITAEGLEFGLLLGTQIGTGTLEGTLAEKCKESMSTGKIGAAPGNMGKNASGENILKGEIIELTFAGCEPCKKITTTPPFTGNIGMTGTSATKEPTFLNGTWYLEGGGNASFAECPLGVKCKFGAEKLTPAPTIEMTETEAILNTNKAKLNLEEGSKLICGETGTWNSKYGLRWDLFKDKAHKELIKADPIWPTLVNNGDDV